MREMLTIIGKNSTLIFAGIFIIIFMGQPMLYGQDLIPADERMEHQTAESDSSSQQTVSAGLLPVKESLPYVSDASSIACTKETVEGLRIVGYSLNEIVDNLAKSGESAHAISLAVLGSGGYSGQEIYDALISDGTFSKREAEAAVPLGIRSRGQLFSPKTDKNLTDNAVLPEDIMIQPNPFSENNDRSSVLAAGIQAALNASGPNPVNFPAELIDTVNNNTKK